MRNLARLCLILLLWPHVLAAASTAVPVVTNISGAVALQSSNGARRDVLSSQIVHSGDVVMTGVNSLAIIGLADIAHVRLGPATTAGAFSNGSDLSLHIHSGLVCVQADAVGVQVDAGSLGVQSSRKATIFNLLRDASGTSVAVYQGRVETSLSGKPLASVDAGNAVHVVNGSLSRLALASTDTQFTSLRCPDASVIAQAEAVARKSAGQVASVTPPPANPQSNQQGSGQPTSGGTGSTGGGGGGGGGGIIGVLLGLAAVAALAGGHGGGGGGGGGTPTTPPGSPLPSPLPSVVPSPSPLPTVGLLSVSPHSLSFTDVGSSNSQPIGVSEANFNGNFSVDASACSGIAAISGSPFPGPSATVTVIPQASGTCAISVTDGHGGSSSVDVTVGPFGALSAPSSLSFSGLGATSPFSVSETNYTGPLMVAASNPNIVTVNPPSGFGPGPTGFSARSQGVGNTTLVISDDHGGLQSVIASVVLGGLSLSTPTLQFSGPGDATQSFQASDSPPVAFSAVSSNPGVATVSEDQANAHTATFTVTPVGNGTASIIVNDSDGGQGVVSVGVGVSPLLLKRHPATVPSRAHRMAPAPRPASPPRAALAPTARALLEPTPASPPNAVQPRREPLLVSVLALTFTAGAPAQQIVISEKDYTGLFRTTSSNATVASVDQPSGAGALLSLRVVPNAAGNAVIRIADDHGNVQFVRVTVLPGLRAPRAGRPIPR